MAQDLTESIREPIIFGRFYLTILVGYHKIDAANPTDEYKNVYIKYVYNS